MNTDSLKKSELHKVDYRGHFHGLVIPDIDKVQLIAGYLTARRRVKEWIYSLGKEGKDEKAPGNQGLKSIEFINSYGHPSLME